MSDELWRWQACELAKAIRTLQIKSREAVDACLRRLEQVNPTINAVVDNLGDEAFAVADAADRAVARGGAARAAAWGPRNYQDQCRLRWAGHHNGVAAFKNWIAKADSPCFANWRKAGAVIVGRTNVPPFSARFFTDNALYGRTINPWNIGRTPGCSSGGAAAAIAVGIGALAHGNDRAVLDSLSGLCMRSDGPSTDPRPRTDIRADHVG